MHALEVYSLIHVKCCYIQLFVSRDIVYVRLSSQFRTAADSKKDQPSRKKTAQRTKRKEPKKDEKRQQKEKATESFDKEESELSSDASEEVATTTTMQEIK